MKKWITLSATATMTIAAMFPMMSAEATVSTQSQASSDASASVQYLIKNGMTKLYNWTVVASYAENHLLNHASWTSQEISSVTKSTDIETLVLANLASHLDPHDYQGHNLVQELASRQIKSGANEGYFADDSSGATGGSIVGQAYAIVALVDAGASFDETGAAKWLLAQQNTDGGFGYQAGVGSDTNSTSYAITALALLGYKADSTPVAKALRYVQSLQQQDGGFGYDKTSKASDSDSTGVVMDALASVGLSPAAWTQGGNTPLSALLGLHDAATGGFKFDNSGSSWSGPNAMSTRDGIFGLQAYITGHSVFTRLHWTSLSSVNSYWTKIKNVGGVWSYHHWVTWAQLKPMAAAGTYFAGLNPYWQNVAIHHGLWEQVGGKPTWVPWNSALARQALAATYGLDSVDQSGL